MWAELLERLLTTCPRPVRDLGYLRELINLRKRTRLLAAEWAPHFAKVRGAIVAAIPHCRQRRKAVVLGSGWLSDVPLDELADAFREVILVDVLHPYAVRRQVRRRPNVRLLTADVTGTVAEVHQAVWCGDPLPESKPTLFLDDPEVDLTASVMLLSQLHLMPEQFLTRQGSHEADAVERYARGVLEGHLAYLKKLPGVVTLITDVENLMIATTGRVVRRHRLLRGLTLPPENDSWTWPLVPATKVAQGQDRLVIAVTDLKAPRAAPG